MTVRDNIRAKMAAIENERKGGGPTPTADEVQNKAMKAILGGQNTRDPAAAWADYMRLFALPDKPEQLARLIPTDTTINDPDRQKARAYLVGNGVCGAGTTGLLDNNVTNKLDEG